MRLLDRSCFALGKASSSLMSKHCWDREQYRCLRGSEGAPRSDMLKEEQRLRETGNYTESEICEWHICRLKFTTTMTAK